MDRVMDAILQGLIILGLLAAIFWAYSAEAQTYCVTHVVGNVVVTQCY